MLCDLLEAESTELTHKAVCLLHVCLHSSRSDLVLLLPTAGTTVNDSND